MVQNSRQDPGEPEESLVLAAMGGRIEAHPKASMPSHPESVGNASHAEETFHIRSSERV